MSRADIVAAVRDELATAAPDAPADPPEDADLRHDLGIDSLAILELVARLEYRFGIAVPDDAWPRLTSVGAVADYLVELQPAR